MRRSALVVTVSIVLGILGGAASADYPGTIHTVAGSGGSGGYSGDGGLATMARLFTPYDVAMDSGSNLLVADRSARSRASRPSPLPTASSGQDGI